MKRQWAHVKTKNEKNKEGRETMRGNVREREVEVEKCVGGKETERKTDGDLRATVTPGLVLFIQSSRH